jgi:hypothetical protein
MDMNGRRLIFAVACNNLTTFEKAIWCHVVAQMDFSG